MGQNNFIMKTALQTGTYFKWMLLLLSLALITDTTRASRPMPADTIRAIEVETVYADSVFVEFKTKYINTMEEMTETYNSFYDKYVLPYVAYALAENDTVLVFVRNIQDHYNNIKIYSASKNVSVTQCLTDTPYLSHPPEFSNEGELQGDLTEYYLITTIQAWDTTEIINLFCTSRLYPTGREKDNYTMNVYRIVKKGDAITEYASISCYANTSWALQHKLK